MTAETETIQRKDDGGSEDQNQLECPVCGSVDVREHSDTAEIVCQSCGAVIEEDMVEESAEARAFTAEEREKRKRTGSPLTYTKHDRGISTQIGHGGSLSEVSPSKRGQYHRIRRWDRRIAESRSRNLRFALSELQKLVDDLNLPKSVHEESARLYDKAIEQETVKGRKIEKIVAALVLLVARSQRVPRTLREVAEASDIDKRELGKNYRYVARELDLRIIPARPEDFIPRFGSNLDFSGETQARARHIIERAREEDLISGRSPEGVVAAALYIASLVENEKRSQKRIADTIGVTEVTIRKGYQDFIEGLGLEEEVEEAREDQN